MNKVLKFGGVTLGLVILALLLVIGTIMGWMAWRRHQFTSLEDTRDLTTRAGTMAETYLEKRPRAALVIGIYRQGELWVKGFGRYARDANSTTPDGSSIYEIGSITKVFSGIALATAMADGAVQVDDPIGSHMRELGIPEDGRGTITFRQLATHRSGLPRLPQNFWTIVGTNTANPYANYSLENLFTDFNEVKLNSLPGDRADYSNYGIALLGQLVALASTNHYETLVRQRILDPLGLDDTRFHLNDEQQQRLVGGFNVRGEPVPNWEFDAMSPAGGLKSTANDMLKFIRANLNPDDQSGSIAESLKLALSEYARSNSDVMGLGWHQQETVEGLKVWWHNGGTGGYASFLGLDPSNQTGVVVLSNHGDAMAGRFDIDKIGMNLLRLAPKVSLE